MASAAAWARSRSHRRPCSSSAGPPAGCSPKAAPDHAKVLIGKDTRVSGYLLESALEAGLSAAGVDIRLLGPMPTPAIAYLTRTARASAGIVISASHNPFEDNGIKFFSAEGIQAPGRGRERHRAGHARADDHSRARRSSARSSVTRMPPGVTSSSARAPFRTACISMDSRSLWIVQTAPPTRWRRWCSPNWAPMSSRSPTRRTASTSTTSAARLLPVNCKRRCWPRRPISVSPWMATAIVWCWSIIAVRWWTATRCCTSSPARGVPAAACTVAWSARS